MFQRGEFKLDFCTAHYFGNRHHVVKFEKQIEMFRARFSASLAPMHNDNIGEMNAVVFERMR